MHRPAISVPALTGPAGMPIGIYVVRNRNGDRDLLSHARWMKRALTG
jgi:Asp-tRNA(Asn)/Glu-tRNA(Gln) amidotransferase A subunit family amidase